MGRADAPVVPVVLVIASVARALRGPQLAASARSTTGDGSRSAAGGSRTSRSGWGIWLLADAHPIPSRLKPTSPVRRDQRARLSVGKARVVLDVRTIDQTGPVAAPAQPLLFR